ncbi:MAG: bifunctional DNA-formamidopyrimidine glycosylase/DNA-(apurinic or apyrimidinic site) lyase [Acidobacteriota bacterium]
MPELPEVETVRRALAQHLCGQEVTAVHVLNPRLRMPVDARALAGLVGLPLQAANRRGKYLLLLFPGRIMVCHLGMSGRFSLSLPGEELPAHTHVVFAFSSGQRLVYVDPRRFGLLLLVDREELIPFFPLGPEPTDVSAVEQQLLVAKKRSKSPVRNVLLDQKIIAGVGNIYANEALFAAGIRPQTPMGRLTRKQISALSVALRQVIERAIAAGGTTLKDGSFRNALGDPGYFAVDLAVYDREGQPCVRCGKGIRRLVLTGRSAYFCPSCQH